MWALGLKNAHFAWQDPLAWPYERLAATYGCTVEETKEMMLLGAARGTRRDGRPFNVMEVEAPALAPSLKFT